MIILSFPGFSDFRKVTFNVFRTPVMELPSGSVTSKLCVFGPRDQLMCELG